MTDTETETATMWLYHGKDDAQRGKEQRVFKGDTVIHDIFHIFGDEKIVRLQGGNLIVIREARW